MQQHILSRLTTSSSSTGSNSRYDPFLYDTLTKLSVNHQDTRIALNRVLTASNNRSGGLCLRSKNDSTLLESINSTQMVRNLSVAQKYIKNDFFSTYACNKNNTSVRHRSRVRRIQKSGNYIIQV